VPPPGLERDDARGGLQLLHVRERRKIDGALHDRSFQREHALAACTIGRTYHLLFIFFVQYTLLFPGESLLLSTPYSELAPGKETVWALYTRAQLLWHSCLRVRHDSSLTEAGKADFAMRAWLETEAIESTLNTHTCSVERAFMYLGREYLFKCVLVDSLLVCLYTPGAENF